MKCLTQEERQANAKRNDAIARRAAQPKEEVEAKISQVVQIAKERAELRLHGKKGGNDVPHICASCGGVKKPAPPAVKPEDDPAVKALIAEVQAKAKQIRDSEAAYDKSVEQSVRFALGNAPEQTIQMAIAQQKVVDERNREANERQQSQQGERLTTSSQRRKLVDPWGLNKDK